VSHFVLLSATERSRYLRIAKSPRGPTVTWRIASYAHASEIAAAQARPRAPEAAFRAPPLVVLNNFGTEPHMKLAAIMFQNMFPPVNVHTVKLAATQRVLLVDYDRASGRFRLRHYAIAAKQVGVNRRLRRLLTTREVPDLGGCADVADFLSRAAGDASDSEGEDGAAARVTLAQDVRGAGNTTGAQSSIRLQEIGPRMDLELLKVEEGLCGGAVLFHAHVAKSAEEAAALEREARAKEASKVQRRVAQEANVARKRAAADAREAARVAARAARAQARVARGGEEADDEEEEDGGAEEEEEDEEEEGEDDDDDDDDEEEEEEEEEEPPAKRGRGKAPPPAAVAPPAGKRARPAGGR
jgi:ribosome biogenesis protein SSF1/2